MSSKCAICSRPVEAAFKPFCSKRCADVDLERWLSGRYVLPGAPVEGEGEGLPSLDEED